MFKAGNGMYNGNIPNPYPSQPNPKIEAYSGDGVTIYCSACQCRTTAYDLVYQDRTAQRMCNQCGNAVNVITTLKQIKNGVNQ